MQHLAMAVFRSVENRKTTVRGTNSGMTCLIDPKGKIIDPMEPFKVGWHIYDVPVYSSDTQGMTTYTKYDDWFAFLSVYLSAILLLGGVLHKCYCVIKKRKKD
jgi:apolipoprotein N-acyltransferase